MQRFCNFLLVFAWSILLTGCSTTITNLTPSQQDRNPSGLYPVAVAWHSPQRSILDESIKPYVIVGLEAYPMQLTPLTRNRWETLVPVSADKNFLNYRFKFDFEYLSIPQRKGNSKLSQPFQLRIVDR